MGSGKGGGHGCSRFSQVLAYSLPISKGKGDRRDSLETQFVDMDCSVDNFEDCRTTVLHLGFTILFLYPSFPLPHKVLAGRGKVNASLPPPHKA